MHTRHYRLFITAVLWLGMVCSAEAGINVWTPERIAPHVVNLSVVPGGMPSTLYAATSTVDNGIVFKTTDAGNTWSATSLEFPVLALSVDPATPTTVYVGTQGYDETMSRLFKSIDGGESWSAADTGLRNDSGGVTSVIVLVIDPLTPSTLYAGTDQGVFKSTDAGDTWSAANMGLPNEISTKTMAVDPVTTSTLYAGMAAGVFKSVDGGGTWSASKTGLPSDISVHALAVDPVTTSVLYAGTNRGVFKSIDAGGNWSVSSNGLPTVAVSALAIDPLTPSTLYAGTYSGDVSKTTDGGANWNTLNTGLSAYPDDPEGPYAHPISVSALAVDSLVEPSRLYAATSEDLFSIEQVAACIGDCRGVDAVEVNDLVTLVNIALGTMPPLACAGGGVPIGGVVDVAVIIEAVNNALNGCSH